jgi:hypothetical protein
VKNLGEHNYESSESSSYSRGQSNSQSMSSLDPNEIIPLPKLLRYMSPQDVRRVITKNLTVATKTDDVDKFKKNCILASDLINHNLNLREEDKDNVHDQTHQPSYVLHRFDLDRVYIDILRNSACG